MITTGSKFFFGLAGASLLAAVVYGVITNGMDQGGVITLLTGAGAVDAVLGPLTLGYKGGVGEHVGYVLLLGSAVSCLALGLATSAFRDGDVESLAELDPGAIEAPAALAPTAANYWPLAAAAGGALVTLGLALGPVIFVVGSVIVALAAVMWTVRAWADGATADPAVNRTVRDRFIRPFEFPVGALLSAAALVFCLSRLFLALGKNGSWIAALLSGAVIFTVGNVMSTRPQLRRGLVGTVLAVGFAVVVATGIVGAVKGERFHHEAPSAETGGH